MSAVAGSLADDLIVQAGRNPHATAVAMADERLTYDQLEAASRRLAQLLAGLGCGHGDRVALLTPKSPGAVVAMLATVRAGAAYVPVDLGSPPARIGRQLAWAQPSAAIVLGRGADLVAELCADGAIPPAVRIVALDERAAEVTARTRPPALGPGKLRSDPGGPLPSPGRGADPAHILFTSGSTGEPKGVVITHDNVRAFLDWAVPYFGIGPGDRLSGHPPLHFDLSTFDVYGAIRAGAELHLVGDDVVLPGQIAAFIAERELTQWFSVPSALSYLAQFAAVPDGGFPSLHRVLWCGEVLPIPTLVHWMSRHPRARFTNLYGPTETTIASSYHPVDRMPSLNADPLPIGTPCAGEELVVLDDGGAPARPGQAGEICIGGAGLSPGYWRDPERTAGAFRPDPRPGRAGERLYHTGDFGLARPDGALEFLGRADAQIKSRGYRIELGEIEAAISRIPAVRECAVVAVASAGFDGRTICCAYAAAESLTIESIELRRAASALLPGYMLPSRWWATDRLPRNPSGKIDRRWLQERFAAEAGGAARAASSG